MAWDYSKQKEKLKNMILQVAEENPSFLVCEIESIDDIYIFYLNNFTEKDFILCDFIQNVITR